MSFDYSHITKHLHDALLAEALAEARSKVALLPVWNGDGVPGRPTTDQLRNWFFVMAEDRAVMSDGESHTIGWAKEYIIALENRIIELENIVEELESNAIQRSEY